jgi:tRNA(Ile)-lysidine synthase
MHLTDQHDSQTISPFSPFFVHLDAVDWQRPVAIAVSGGGDSMALLATVLDLRQQRSLDATVVVLTVNHDLRREAAHEAASVARFCEQQNIDHHILTWVGAKPASAMAETARLVRRELLLSECRTRGVGQLLLAHTMDDVCETLLMRVRRGGLRGHASIAPQTCVSGIRLLRPFLQLSRHELRSALRMAGIHWFDDPSNENMNYERPRVRRSLGELAQRGFPLELIARYAMVMGRWRSEMAQGIATVIEDGCLLSGPDVRLRAGVMRGLPKIVAVEALRELVRFVGGDAYMIDFPQAEAAIARLLNDGIPGKAFSAGRCVLSPQGDGIWLIARALRDLPTVSVDAGESVTWDGRFLIWLDAEAPCSATISSRDGDTAANEPGVSPETLPHRLLFRPRVMDGPVTGFDRPVFQAFEKLLSQENR